VTLRDNTERPESVEVGANVLAGADPARIEECARQMSRRPRDWQNPFGDGHSGLRIVDLLVESARPSHLSARA
jgi:UDP-N-acetylglucosamine 2-epimerase (non-hydrolysing)